MREYTLVQGHPYSNDDDEPGVHVGPKGTWIVVILIGVVVGCWLWNKDRKR